MVHNVLTMKMCASTFSSNMIIKVEKLGEY